MHMYTVLPECRMFYVPIASENRAKTTIVVLSLWQRLHAYTSLNASTAMETKNKVKRLKILKRRGEAKSSRQDKTRHKKQKTERER